ncbi:MAG TPA: TIGR00725 family protein [Candidatus Binatia bacterium]|nr:TIGR00725 family protein [Candidatus Binatia bacterium]
MSPGRRRRRAQIAVAGGGRFEPTAARLAREVGREIAAAGAVLVCGGLGGVMAAAARGAAEAGGLVVGILPGYDATKGNRFLDVAVPTGLGHARNVLVAAAGDALIALPGEHGTLSEIALAGVLGRPVVVLGAWADVPGVRGARTPRDAVHRALRLARRRVR